MRAAALTWLSQCAPHANVGAHSFLPSKPLQHPAAATRQSPASVFGKQTNQDILQDASGSPDSIQLWGWGCNSRGQLGPLAPSASVVEQPQCLLVVKAGQRLDSISAGARVFARNFNSLRCRLFQSQGCTTLPYSHGKSRRGRQVPSRGVWT